MENKHERYQKAMNIIDVLEGSQFCQNHAERLNVEWTEPKHQSPFPSRILKDFFRLGSITDGKLFIEVKSAVVRQGILFRQSELLAAIQPTYPEVKGFEIKINPELTC